MTIMYTFSTYKIVSTGGISSRVYQLESSAWCSTFRTSSSSLQPLTSRELAGTLLHETLFSPHVYVKSANCPLPGCIQSLLVYAFKFRWSECFIITLKAIKRPQSLKQKSTHCDVFVTKALLIPPWLPPEFTQTATYHQYILGWICN
jgi:hypothetical protein